MKNLILHLFVLFPVLLLSQTQTENYIKTTTYKVPTPVSIATPGTTQATQNVTYFDGLGRPIQTVSIKQGGIDKTASNNLLDWKGSWTIGGGSVVLFNQNGDTAENVRINGVGPFGKNAVLWQCVNDAASDADGGWNSNSIAIDKTVSYRYSVWVKRTGGQDGYTYHGTQNVVNLDGTANTNPYFWYGILPSADTWYLMVGMIHPASYTGVYSGISGLYDTAGNKVGSGSDYKWSSTTVDTYFRSYLYYATNTNTRQYFYNPTVQKMNGTEASLAGLVLDSDSSDIVTPIDYDGFGRQDKDYLPYAGNGNGAFQSNALADVNNYYINNYPTDINPLFPNPFSQKQFEPSPLNRVLQQGAPGNDWKLGNGHEIKLDYQTNIAGEVKLYTASTIWNATLGLYDTSLGNSTGGIFYEANQLYKTVTYDENTAAVPTETNGSTVEFKNKQGQVVLKRAYESGVKHDTYYVYDDYGNLTYVLPPLPIQDNPGGANSITTGYNNFGLSFDQSVFSGTSSGGGSVGVSIRDNVLTVSFGASFMTSYLNTTPQDLPTNPCLLPDMYLGTISGGTYSVSIVGGKLKLTSLTGTPTGGFSATFTVVLPTTCTPRPANIISKAVLDDLCYQYKYDSRNRLVEKKLPGKQWEFIVYDKLDRVVATGPAYSSFTDLAGYNGWLITKYDAFNRPVYTGWENAWASTSTRATKQTAQNALTTLNETKQSSGTIDGIAAYYTNAVAPTTFKLLTVNYYDNYSFPNIPVIPTSVEGQTALTTDQVRSLPTGSWTRVLTTSGAALGETAATFYDAKARPIRSYMKNYLGGYTQTDTKLDFVGVPQYSITTHRRLTGDPTELKTTEAFTYSPQGRLLTHTHQIGTGTVQLLTSNTYDELGQLVSKKVGGIDTTGTTGLQTVDYKYNIRGWLKNINDVNTLGTDLFAFKLNYNDIAAGVTPLFNGNISQTFWDTANTDKTLKNYTYTYDKLNRLKTATDNQGRYNENLWYNKNGNITSLTRMGMLTATPTFGSIDNLIYSYDAGNKLTKVEDSSGSIEGFKNSSTAAIEYTYDANGNMLTDLNKGITAIVYNHLNLPTKITFATGNIVYLYNAGGQKVKKVVTVNSPASTTTTDYLGGYQYLNTSLQFFPTAEGYVTNNAGTYSYIYQYKDHLGNVRLSYDKNLQIVEENNYYPFGLIQKGYNNTPNYSLANVEGQKYKYNGKELQDELGLNLYDFGARNYDPAIGRWMNMDP